MKYAESIIKNIPNDRAAGGEIPLHILKQSGFTYQMLTDCINGALSLRIVPDRYSSKGALSGLRQFLANESPLKLMKNAFYFTLKALFVPKIFKFLSLLFGHVEKRLD